MRTVQLFVSSPGDVELERARVDRVTERLNGEFWPRVHFQTLRWETKYYSAHKSFQEHIAETATCDVVIGTFWSRLGTELPAHVSDKYRMADGRPYPSGSAYEVLTAIEARKSADRPDVYVFRKTAPAMVALNDPVARAEADRQWERLEDFFARWFRAPGGTFLKAYHEFKTTDQFEDAVEKLLRTWLDDKVLAGRAITWPIETKGSPFRGLAPFDAKHAPVFFGRSRKVMRAVDHLKSAARLSLDAAGRESADPAARQLKPFLLIVGPSGSGKSSLMRAGVGPRITAAGVVPEVDHWRIAVMRPGDDANAFEALARALMVTGKGDDPGGFGCALPEICDGGVTVAALAGQFESAIQSATAAVVAALDRVAAALREKQGFDRPVGVNLLLMVDQLEDIFAASVTDEQRTAFAGLLSALGATKRIWIVSTLRGDLYNRLLKNRALIALKDAGQTYDLAPPGAEEVAEIIQQSAEAAGLTYETDPQSGERLDDRLIADAEGKDVLPLLQFTLDRLFADRRVEGDAIYLTFASYRAMGGLDGAIDQVAESAIGKLGGAEIAALPRLLRSLAVTVREETGAAGELTVRAVPASDVIRNQATRGLADALIKARILLTSGAGEDGAGDESGLLRVAHQRVFESWRKARAILDEDRDYFRIRDVVEDQRERWQSSGQSRDLLVASGLPLEQAKSLVNRYGDELPPETHAFVRQSVARANRTRNIKRALQAGLAVFAVVATLAGVAARHYGNRAVANYESARQTVDDLVRSITERLRDTDRINVATVEDALNAVRPLVDKLETSSGGDPELKRTRAAMHYEFARTFQSADDHARALKEANESLALREGLLQLRPGEAEWEWDFSLSLDLVGDTERILRNHDRAGERYESALRIRDELIRRSPDTAKYLYGKSQSLIRSGDLTLELADQAKRIPRDQANESARLAYEAALDLGVAVLRRERDNELYQRELSWGFQKIGVIRARMASHAEALDAHENALCVRRYLSSRNDRNTLRRRDVAFSLERVGDARQRLNDLPRAADALFEALTIRRALSGGDPNHGLWGRELTATLRRLGNLKRDMKDGELAAGYYLLAIQVANVILERAPETRFLLRERDDSKAAYDAATGQLRAAPSALVPHDAALREAAEREESMRTRALAAPRGNVLACWDDLQMKLGLPTRPPQPPARADEITPACLPACRRASYGRLMADVRLTGITKTWGTAAAVEDVSFSAPAGHLVALLGPSGCGKSTTLRLIAGLETASAGTITIENRDVTALPPAKRGVSMVFQSYALFPHLSVAENILFGLKVRDVPRPERTARLSRAAGILGLETLLDRKPSQLSGGQQQRVALGRAIVAETKVCLMDEPLSNLDAQLRVEMRREIRALQRRLGITMLYVTHDQVEAMTMADQVVLMRNGRIEQDAAPAALYEKPATIFAARFVGTPPMNVIPAALVPADLANPPRARDTLAIGIRPEAVRLGANGMAANVVAVEYLGADTLIDTRVADQSFIVRVGGRASVNVGDTVHLAWDAGAAHWFDLSSQRRIDQ